MNPISVAIAAVFMGLGVLTVGAFQNPYGAAFIGLAGLTLASLKMAQQWEKAVILRAGKFTAIEGPGLFLIIPILDAVAGWVDTRVRTTQFVAEQTLTKDTVPVDVDAIIFWIVIDVRKAALEVMNFEAAVAWASQTSLREMIGAAELSTLLSNRAAVDEQLRKSIDTKTEDWGIRVKSVEIRDVRIPVALQDAMSRQAQAERERQARVILGSAEAQIAQKFVEAADTYANNPVALHLRGMNMLYESVKERGSTIIVPSSAIDSMNLGGLAGITSLAKNTAAEAKPAPKKPGGGAGPWSPDSQ
ncbi:MAG: slipin family protein [Proteobacteria bacterium]|nr:slipin family protein [Pseudomonadota bacterium]